jgi:hypothetical protein
VEQQHRLHCSATAAKAAKPAPTNYVGKKRHEKTSALAENPTRIITEAMPPGHLGMHLKTPSHCEVRFGSANIRARTVIAGRQLGHGADQGQTLPVAQAANSACQAPVLLQCLSCCRSSSANSGAPSERPKTPRPVGDAGKPHAFRRGVATELDRSEAVLSGEEDSHFVLGAARTFGLHAPSQLREIGDSSRVA